MVIEPTAGWRGVDVRELWAFRELLAVLVWRDVKVRYKQTALGAAWAVIQPVAAMVVFSVFFGRLAGLERQTEHAYPLFVYSALLPWQLFANGVQLGSMSLVGNELAHFVHHEHQGLAVPAPFHQLLAALGEESGRHVRAATSALLPRIRDERALARLVAQRYGAKAHEFVVEPRLTNVLDDIVTAFDEPFADDSVVPSYYVCQQTSHHVKVALSGLGGDELFGGYHRYRGLHASQFYDALPSVLRKRVIDPVVQKIPEPTSGNDQIDHIKRFSRASVSSPDRRYYEYVSSLGEGDRDHLYRPQFRHTVNYAATRALITDPFNRHPHRSLVDRAIYTDLKTYLPGDILALSDRLSMWHSLELRVPLIDHELAELAMRIPSKFKTSLRDTKIVLKGVARRWVPQEILTSRKQGFESPMGAWIRTDLREYVEDTLFGESAVVRDYFDMATVRELFEQHCSGARKNSKILFSLIMFEAWHRHGRARTGR